MCDFLDEKYKIEKNKNALAIDRRHRLKNETRKREKKWKTEKKHVNMYNFFGRTI